MALNVSNVSRSGPVPIPERPLAERAIRHGTPALEKSKISAATRAN